MKSKAIAVCMLLHCSLANLLDCRDVKGRISSTVVSETPPLRTEGKFTGGLRGDFDFELKTLEGFPSLAEQYPVTPLAGVGLLTMTLTSSNLCDKGTVLEIVDASSFVPVDPPDDSYFGGVQTIQPHNCGITGGYITTSGLFNGGCQDCVYNGV